MRRLRAGDHRWTVSRDLGSYESALEIVKDGGEVRYPAIDLRVARRAWERYGWVADDFGSVRGETRWSVGFARAGWPAPTPAPC